MKYLILLLLMIPVTAFGDDTPYGAPDYIPDGVVLGECSTCAIEAIQQDPSSETSDTSSQPQETEDYE